MDKDEILRRSREAHADEGQEWIRQQATDSGAIWVAVAFIVLFGFNMVWAAAHSTSPASGANFALLCVFFAAMGGQAWGRLRSGGGRRWLATVILAPVASLAAGSAYILSVILGW